MVGCSSAPATSVAPPKLFVAPKIAAVALPREVSAAESGVPGCDPTSGDAGVADCVLDGAAAVW